MEQIKKFIDFLGISYPRHIDEERHSFQKSNYLIPKEITKWWAMGLQDFVKYVHSADHDYCIGFQEPNGYFAP
jgi:hypothetical protein